MGTHNRVIAISSESFPDCYVEVIAIDPDAPAPGRRRWFGLDHPEVREAVRESLVWCTQWRARTGSRRCAGTLPTSPSTLASCWRRSGKRLTDCWNGESQSGTTAALNAQARCPA
jgi:Glyoxalase-like domain